ncbi:hypothetical protein KC19_2G038400 [Ceratodon purpureus]|uniref:Uncharacterized protein n=1 Tax=Ceratodon purpureus TaxID=3225 RepID=A0A8T0IPV7_CERPU|nr:hypothetical protein KC19_2G038400 [Ceratodon purpureus]
MSSHILSRYSKPPKSLTSGNLYFSNDKHFNMLDSLSLRLQQKARRSLLQERAAPTGFPPPAANDHAIVSEGPYKFCSPPPPPPPTFLRPPPLPP